MIVPGTFVMLNSGGPRSIVEHYDAVHDRVDIIWVGERFKVFNMNVPRVCVTVLK